MTRHALISGASVAGPALALQLNAAGWRTTVVERAPQLRDEGQNIDVRGAAREVARRMGIEDAVRAAGTGEVGLRFVDGDGAAVGEFPAGEGDSDGATAELEILRGELSRVLYDRTRDATDYRFGDRIADVTDHGDRVTARLESGAEIDADVLVVAEGARSRTRDLVMGAPDLREFGLYIAYLTIPRTAEDDRWWRWHHAPGAASVSLRPDNRGTTRAMLTFRSDVRGIEALDRDGQVTILRRTFADVGWQAQRVLDALDDAPLYFDAVAQARLPRWSSGRTVLLGDAAWAPGPFGTGTSLALVGAYVLAGELATSDADPAPAFTRYEATMRPFVDRAQNVSPSLVKAMNPRSAAGVALQRAVICVAAPVTRTLGGVLGALVRPRAEAIDLPDYPREPRLVP